MRRLEYWGTTVLLIITVVTWGAVAAQDDPSKASFTLEPGGTATIEFESFCLDYGKQFPNEIGLPLSDTAGEAVKGVLNYAVTQGYASSDPKEAQFAIWDARGAVGAPQTGTIGSEILQNANPSTIPDGAISVIDALNNQQLTATTGSWGGVGEQLRIGDQDQYFKGKGELILANTTQQQLTLYMPLGTVFAAANADFQSMAGYATNISVDNPDQVLPTTGIISDMSRYELLLMVLLALDIGAIGLLIQHRARAY